MIKRRPTGQLVYVTDFGAVPLPDAVVQRVEDSAASVQHGFWLWYQDDMVGVPEVDPWCNNTHRMFNRNAHDVWVAGKELDGGIFE